ncbi:AraC-like DNA-binding protein [Tenacibaculum sp. 190524A02b]|uniref:AraC-like DNA-binding protein n=1 Tax=Tenacibaculum vairaonense TaxID=3137860 RepID=A0ABM9PLH1_9FLAO
MNNTKTYCPNYPLNQFINAIWVSQSDNYEIQTIHYAPLFTELIFNYGDSFSVNGQNVEEFNFQNNHQILSGLKTKPFHTQVSGKHLNVGLILKPFCYGLIAKQINSSIIGNLSEILFEQFFIKTKPDFKKIEVELFKLFQNSHLENDLIKFETYLNKKIVEPKRMKDFNKLISISQKSFIQKFKNTFHIAPNEYVRLKQVNHAIIKLKTNKYKNLTNLGLDCGFYDQSHFIRTFKKYSGLTPKQFMKG